ncbi:MAG: T9SS type A sorting domain-containing protein [Cyclobacteriaceae bacterium]|nr:T9SS type A sorting domain-containing protein [Cyclobacteriaceae bacterium HetDA_MAG_MS6]
MKSSIYLLFLLCSLHVVGQTTHQITVKVNQGPDCPALTSIDTQEAFQVYPNPVSDVLYLESNTHSGSASLLNLNGKVLRKTSLHHGSAAIDVKALAPGIYILRFIDNSRLRQVKVRVK